eukprot:TRINITY_DN31084_c0_g1_i1.p1 TRINITY_DN31084_c0_g1~~TRINITY_DN31084_c0_g1_i1.p1  ORF type:complete len:275 (+),score=10.57 TRINITY_DN31084_c0_g1_i1:46-870(+)
MHHWPPEETIDVEAELARLDREGRVLDFDDQDRSDSLGASMCAIGFFLTMQTTGAFLIHENMGFPFVVLSLLTNTLYFKLVVSNPGRLPKGSSTSPLREEVLQITDKYRNGMSETALCRFCRTTRPPRAKHCHKCGTCIAKFDHHCFWLNNCVGARNHRLFLTFLAFVTLWLLWSGAHLISALAVSSGYTYYTCLVTIAVDMGMALFSLPLLVGHLIFACCNITTFEFAKPEKAFYLPPNGVNIFNNGILENLRRFCCVTSALPKEDYGPVVGF